MSKPTHEGPHKYFQTVFKQSGTLIFRCGLPNCPHFLYEPMIIARVSICWRCGNRFIITSKSVRAKKMHCEECTRERYNKVKERKPEEFSTSIEYELDKLLSKVEQEVKEKNVTESEGKNLS